MHFKRITALLLVILILVFAVSCSKKEPTNNSGDNQDDSAASLEPENKNVLGWLWSDDPLDAEIAGFIKDNPEYTIDNTTRNSGVFEDHTQDLPRLASAVASDESPDIYWGWSVPAEAFYTDLFMPLQDYFDKDPEMEEEDFHPTALKLLTFNDKIYFTTNEYAAYMFVWNRDIFEDVGLDPNVGPKTWDEFVEFGTKATTYTPSGALKTIGVEQEHMNIPLWHAAYTGKYIVDETGLKFDYNNKTFLDTLEFAKSLSDIYGGNEKKGDGWWWFPFNNIGMTNWGGSYISGVNSSIGQLPLPEENSERHLQSGVGPLMGIPRNAKNPLAGWHAMKYFNTDGVLAREVANYQDQVEVYIPRYVVHKPTAVKVKNYFEPLLDEVRLENSNTRNAMIETADVPGYSSPVTSVQKYWDENLKKVYSDELAPKDFLLQLQEFADAETASFIKQKEAEGWEFTDKGSIPPSEKNAN